MDPKLTTRGSQRQIHAASLIDRSLHSQVLLQLLNITAGANQPGVVEYVVNAVIDTVEYAMLRSGSRPLWTPTPEDDRQAIVVPRHTYDQATSEFMTFTRNVVERAAVTMPVILGTLVYVHKAKPYLWIKHKEWVFERVFLGAVMLASKYLNDSVIQNIHWAMCTNVFGKRDVGLIEREMLGVLNYELRILENDILAHLDGLSAAIVHHQSFYGQPANLDDLTLSER